MWWHLNQDVAITSEWATPSMIEDGLNPEDLLGKRFGHHLLLEPVGGGLLERIDLGDEHQMVLELRPAHDPRQQWGFVGVVISVEDLSASGGCGTGRGDRWEVNKAITIPAEPAEASDLPPTLQPFGAVPPLVTDIDLSVDDAVALRLVLGHGGAQAVRRERPARPEGDRVHQLGGIARQTPHPAPPDQPLRGPADGGGEPRRPGGVRRNSLFAELGRDLLPRGWGGDVDGSDRRGYGSGGDMALDERFFPNGDDSPRRWGAARLQGGDASNDSYCFVD